MVQLHTRWTFTWALVLGLASSGLASASPILSTIQGVDLPDFSYAGYRMGEEIPDTSERERVNAGAYGAIPDDDLDDSEALLAAIDAAAGQGHVVLLKSGVYDIHRPIRIDQGDWIIRGESQQGTILRFHKPLCESAGDCPAATSGSRMSPYSVGPGLIQIAGGFRALPSGLKSRIKGSYPRGSRNLILEASNGTKPGSEIVLTLRNPESNSLAREMHGNFFTPVNPDYAGRPMVRFASRVLSVSAGSIELERPLPVSIKPEWQPEVQDFLPRVSEVGLENLTILMRHEKYPGHFKEKGFNGVTFAGVVNSWMKDVAIVNSDLAIHLSDSQFNSFVRVQMEVDASRGAMAGHHAIWLSSSHDNLFSDFAIGTRSQSRFIHDLSVSWYSRGNVFEKGVGYDMNLDHHGAIPYQNLFTEIDLGLGRRSFESGGGARRMPNSGWMNIYWTLQGAGFSYPDCKLGGGNLVFVNTPGTKPGPECSGWIYQSGTESEVNLYRAQRARRLGGDQLASGAE